MGNKSSRTSSGQQLVPQSNPSPSKVLILGTSFSGKSTLFKQTISSFEDDLYQYHYQPVIQSCLCLLRYIVNLEPEEFDMEIVTHLNDAINNGTEKLSEDVLLQLQEIWNEHSELCEQYKTDIGLRMYYGMGKYMNQLVPICDGTLKITTDMVLSCFTRTTGINENTFKYENAIIDIFDVGGRRSERKKWIHCFEGTKYMIVTVSLTEYCEVLAEDDTVNSMDESLKLFSDIVNSEWFIDVPILLLFTKKDLLLSCLSRYPLPDDAPQNLRKIYGKRILSRKKNTASNRTINGTIEKWSIEMFQNLPSDVIDVNILPYLTLTDISTLSIVNKYMHEICGSEQLWKVLIMRDIIDPDWNQVHSIFENDRDCAIHMRAYKYYYYWTIYALKEEAIQYFTNKFMSTIKSDTAKVESFSLNLLDDQAIQQIFNKLLKQ
jgi:guanine nucleotide-binding protein G(i) subunit alpha